MDVRDGGIKLFKGCAQQAWQIVGIRLERGRVQPENPEMEFAIEETDAEAVGRHAIAMRARLPLNEATEPEAP